MPAAFLPESEQGEASKLKTPSPLLPKMLTYDTFLAGDIFKGIRNDVFFYLQTGL